MNITQQITSLEDRVSSLETGEGKVAGELSRVQREMAELRVEVKTSIKFQSEIMRDIRISLDRLEERLEDRPSRAELVTATQSRAPRIEVVRDASGTRLSMARVPPWTLVILALFVALTIIAWLVTRS